MAAPQAAAARLCRRTSGGSASSCSITSAWSSGSDCWSLTPRRRMLTRALLGLALADDEHHRHLRQRVLADLVVDLLVAEVELGAEARRRRAAGRTFARIVVGVGRDRRDHRPAPAPATAAGGRHSARSGCRGSARSSRRWRGAASPASSSRRPRRHRSRRAARAGRSRPASVPHCQSRPMASRSTYSNFGP